MGSVAISPLKSKTKINFAEIEIMIFYQYFNHHEVDFYGNNEPTIRSILKIRLNNRHTLGLRTRVLTSRTRDSAGNSLAENAMQRI